MRSRGTSEFGRQPRSPPLRVGRRRRSWREENRWRWMCRKERRSAGASDRSLRDPEQGQAVAAATTRRSLPVSSVLFHLARNLAPCSTLTPFLPSLSGSSSPGREQNETEFNRLPLPARIASTRAFVRDLTFLARNADALVVTGSSNVGRMLMVLHEAEARRRRGENGGAREGEEGKAEGGGRRREMRSLDTRCVRSPIR